MQTGSYAELRASQGPERGNSSQIYARGWSYQGSGLRPARERAGRLITPTMCVGKDGSGRWPLKLLLGAAYCDCEHKVTVWLSHGRRSLSTMINRELDGTRKTADIDEAQHLLLHGRKRTIHPHCTHRQSCPRKQHLPTCNHTRYMRWRSAGERHSSQRQRRDRNRQLDPKWRPEDPAPNPPLAHPGPTPGPIPGPAETQEKCIADSLCL
jgi:hypothetical protein